MVEAAGQLIHLFRDRLDYAFILHAGCGACYPSHRSGRILVPARCAHFASSAVSRSMSLYRAGLRFALFLPLAVAIPPAAFPPCGCRVRRCEPRCHSALSSRGDYLTNRTRVRKRYTVGTTCLARLRICQWPRIAKARYARPPAGRWRRSDARDAASPGKACSILRRRRWAR